MALRRSQHRIWKICNDHHLPIIFLIQMIPMRSAFVCLAFSDYPVAEDRLLTYSSAFRTYTPTSSRLAHMLVFIIAAIGGARQRGVFDGSMFWTAGVVPVNDGMNVSFTHYYIGARNAKSLLKITQSSVANIVALIRAAVIQAATLACVVIAVRICLPTSHVEERTKKIAKGFLIVIGGR